MLYFTVNLFVDKNQKKIMQKFILYISNENLDLINNHLAECFILSKDLSPDFKQKFAQKAKDLHKIILGQSTEECLTYALDGVLIDLSKSEDIAQDYAASVKDLKGKIVGVISRNRRHEAMLISECEPDFIVFRIWKDGQENLQALTSWYAELFLIRSAVMPMESLNYQNFASDFVILDDKTFSSIKF